MYKVWPLSAKFSMAHLRAILLLLEKSNATPTFLSFTMVSSSSFFWCEFEESNMKNEEFDAKKKTLKTE